MNKFLTRIRLLRSLGLLGVFCLFVLSGCKSITETEPAYALAQSCVALKAHDSDTYIVSTENGYGLSDVDESQAEKFYIKPVRLGSFLLYDRDRKFFGLDILRIKRLDTASKKAEWQINNVDVKKGDLKIAGTYTLISPNGDLRLSHKNNRFFMPKADIALVTTQRSSFDFVVQNADSCSGFPEDELDAEVSPAFYTPKNATDPVVGFADIHAHIGFPKSMGSVVMAGNIFHPYGIEHALHDCDDIHGKGGAIDLLEMQKGSSDGHSTRGYPDFEYWPRRDTVSHVQVYHRWLERAYLAGLRLTVTHATGNPEFCQLMGIANINKLEGNCSPADTVRLQTEYMYQLQDYIDAQAGGPGKGWLRIATSSQQARQIINNNKLAIVLGSEYGSLFDCRSSNENCDSAFIDRELQKLHDMGIRSVFPIHRFDNAFGGAQYGGVAWMHLASKMDTGHIDHLTDLVNPSKLLFKPIGGNYFDMEECPEGVQGDSEVPSMRDFFDNDFSIVTDALRGVPGIGVYLGGALDLIFLNKMEPVPDYAHLKDSKSSCNTRSLQGIGQHLVNRLIDKGMIVEVDHMSNNTLEGTMDILEAHNYSGVVSSHGMVRGKDRTVERIYRLGGIAVKFSSKPTNVVDNIQHTKSIIEKTNFELGVGFATDIQGVVSQTTGEDDFIPTYPFKSYDGTVTFTEPKIGNRTIDFNKEGIAHYGMFAEWMENFRQVTQEKGDDSFDIFMNSAEAYLQMWARAEAAAIE